MRKSCRHFFLILVLFSENEEVDCSFFYKFSMDKDHRKSVYAQTRQILIDKQSVPRVVMRLYLPEFIEAQ